jgi:exodeoxyribonuclease-5
MSLNQDQQAAADKILQFLFSPEKAFKLSGAGGTGKTFLMRHIKEELLDVYKKSAALFGMPVVDYEIIFTATTNKAAEVLGDAIGAPAETIHSFLGLKVKNNYSTGKTEIKRSGKWSVKSRKLLFIDEASMTDSILFRHILEGTDSSCKIIYVGDHFQLPPVFEPISPVYVDTSTSFALLTQQMRNNGQPALMQLCEQFRHTVNTGQFFRIPHVPGVIDYLTDEQAYDFIHQTFAVEGTNNRILAYTNKRVQDYNGYIRELRGYGDRFVVGEELINNSGIDLNDQIVLRPEEAFRVAAVDPGVFTEDLPDDGRLDYYKVELERKRNSASRLDVRVAIDPDHLKNLLNYYAQQKDWFTFYALQNRYPDLRPRDASTVHKAQGSTYDTVMIDLSNIGTCRKPEEAARMLYVAVSRPTRRIVLCGDLPDKYTGELFQAAA